MGHRLNVFLVEDSPQIREALTERLELEEGLTIVGYADNPLRAICSLETLDINVVIVDLNLREGSGFQVLSHLLRNGNPKSILRIVLTNHTAPAFRRICESLGAEFFLDKSLELDHAMTVLKEYLEYSKYSEYFRKMGPRRDQQA